MTSMLRALSGLIVWAISFSVIYALQGFACSARFAPLSGRGMLIAAWLLSLAVLGWLFLMLRRSASRGAIIDWLAPALALIGLISTIFTGFPVLFTTLCNSG